MIVGTLRLAGVSTILIKILGRGELKAKLTVSAHKFTASAKAAIEAAGGEAVTLVTAHLDHEIYRDFKKRLENYRTERQNHSNFRTAYWFIVLEHKWCFPVLTLVTVRFTSIQIQQLRPYSDS